MKQSKIDKFIMSNPINFIYIAFFYTLFCLFFPLDTLFSSKGEYATMIMFSISRLIFAIFPLFVYFRSTREKFKIVVEKKNYYFLIALFIICLNNIPFVSIIEGTSQISFIIPRMFLHFVKCISISIFEESVFRGIILVLLLELLKNNKFKFTISVVISSIVFGLTHYVNLFSGESFGYASLQCGYSILLGALFAISFLLTKKLYVSIILHAIFNFGGLLQESGLLSGIIWTLSEVIFTIIIAVIFGLAVIYALYKIEKINQKKAIDYESSGTEDKADNTNC